MNLPSPPLPCEPSSRKHKDENNKNQLEIFREIALSHSQMISYSMNLKLVANYEIIIYTYCSI